MTLSCRLLAAALFFVCLTGCSLTLTDRTGPLSYNTPINEQLFSVEVDATGYTPREVFLSVDGASYTPMTGRSGNLWNLPLPIAPCREVVEYRVRVVYTDDVFGTRASETFPAVGTFRDTVEGQPASCAAYARTVPRVFRVNTPDDLTDALPGDGVCDAYPRRESETCSLRAAVMEANARPGVDLIEVPRGRYHLTLEKPSGTERDAVAEDAFGDLDVTDALTVVGNVGDAARFVSMDSFLDETFSQYVDDPNEDYRFVKIDGNGIDRVFQVHRGGDEEPIFVALENLHLLNGRQHDRPGGGILNEAVLTLSRVVVGENTLAQRGGDGGVFSQNRGAGIANFGRLSAKESAIIHNRIEFRTGIAGGLYNEAGAEAVLEGSLVAFNEARFGSGVYNRRAVEEEPAGRLSMTNVTVTLNETTTGTTGTIVNNGEGELTFVTVAQNRGSEVSRVVGVSNNGVLTLAHSLLVDNSRLPYNQFNSDGDCTGTIRSLGGNVVKDASNCTLSRGGLPDQVNFIDFISLGSLSVQGGFTPVLPLRRPSSSSGLDVIDFTPGFPLTPTDQRGLGFPRYIDGNGDGRADPDPGAYEAPPEDD